MKSLAQQDFAGFAGLELDQPFGLARRQATGAAALAMALAAIALIAALRADPDLRYAEWEGSAARAIAVSASVTPSLPRTN